MFKTKFPYEGVSFSTGTKAALARTRFAFAGLTRNVLTRRATRVLACMCASIVVALEGCVNDNTGTGTKLNAITFSPASGFPQEADPAEFSIGGGSITASGGTAETRGEFGLYVDDLFAWDFPAGPEGMITFNDLDVIAIDGYWVHPDRQTAGGAMTVVFTGGGSATVASAAVNATGAIAQPIGFFNTVTAPEGESITSLVFAFDEDAADGDVAALDVLELTVR